MSSTRTQQALAKLADLTPRQIAAELDRYIVGQADAKKAVAIALRNRWRRQRAPESIREEISPNNIILIGPTGVGKTEIARRLAKLAGAPFIKVEASKFTEVGYVGRDVESMVRDLVESAIDMVRSERESEVEELAHDRVDERLLDLLLPPPTADARRPAGEKSDAAAPADSLADSPAVRPPSAVAASPDALDVFLVSPSGDVTKAPDPALRGGYRRRSNNAGGLEGGVTTGEPLVIRVGMKPISTLMSPLPTVDLTTGKAANAQSERSDVTAVPAMGVIAEGLTALVVADAFLEKFGGDSLAEIRRNFAAYLQNLAARWGALSP